MRRQPKGSLAECGVVVVIYSIQWQQNGRSAGDGTGIRCIIHTTTNGADLWRKTEPDNLSGTAEAVLQKL